MNDNELMLLGMLGDLPLVSGFEQLFIDEVKDIIEDYLGFKIEMEGNNLYYLPKKPSNKVFLAHYDEIGFIVDNQYSPRLYRTIPIGLMEPSRAYGKPMQTLLDGEIIIGIGSSPLPHEDPEEKRLFLEFGEDIEIPPMWPFTFENRIVVSEDYVYSKALDNRAGVIALLSVAKKHKIPFILTHGEEQGFSRFRPVLEIFEDKIRDPKYIVIDSFTSKDDIHIRDGLSENQLGYISHEGAGTGNIASKDMIKMMKKLVDSDVETHSKYEVTDATALYRLGRESIALGYPLKYLHSSFEALHRPTFEKLKKTIEKLHKLK